MRTGSGYRCAILGIGNATGLIDYTVIWRYFSWTNQTLAMIVLWAAAMYLFTEKKNFWMAAVPATFMSAVSCTYFILAPECLGSLLNSRTADGTVIYNTAVAYPNRHCIRSNPCSHCSFVRPKSAAQRNLLEYNSIAAAGRSFVRSAAAIHNDNCGVTENDETFYPLSAGALMTRRLPRIKNLPENRSVRHRQACPLFEQLFC